MHLHSVRVKNDKHCSCMESCTDVIGQAVSLLSAVQENKQPRFRVAVFKMQRTYSSYRSRVACRDLLKVDFSSPG